MEIFRLTWDNHIPVNPATKKNIMKEIVAKKIRSDLIAPLTSVNVQLTTLIVAGILIIIVIVLYRARLRWSKPIKYMWCPHTRNPM